MREYIYSADEIRAILNPVFNRHNVKKAVLFGSYAKGTAEPGSDIDIFVDSGLKGLRFYGLLEDVVNALDKDVDLLDSLQIVPFSEVADEISKSEVLIYSQPYKLNKV